MTTMPLFLESEQDTPCPNESQVPKNGLALSFDHRAWLSFLADEWYVPANEPALYLGVNKPLEQKLQEDRIAVTTWFDPELLPNIKVLRYRKSWENGFLDLQKDKKVCWPSALPLFAVSHFCVKSESDKERLIAMVHGFSNIALPEQPIYVTNDSTQAFNPPKKLPSSPVFPPHQWNALRGAAAMAVWAIPTIDPWLDVLCDSLSEHQTPELLNALDAPWLTHLPWHKSSQPTYMTPAIALWHAMIETLSEVNVREAWRPADLLETICDKARCSAIEPGALDDLLLQTSAILEDRQVVQRERSDYDPVGLVLQLILLRPKPDQFITWKNDMPALPPAVWWSGAILSGLVTGYRNLELRFRGLTQSSRQLALITWQLGASQKAPAPQWPKNAIGSLSWRHAQDQIEFSSADNVWAERPLGKRGSWYRANFEKTVVQDKAIEIARRLFPAALRPTLLIQNSAIQLSGDGHIQIDQSTRQLSISGSIYFDLPNGTEHSERFDSNTFQKWLATGSIAQKLPLPPREIEPPELVTDPVAPSGLKIVRDFITKDEEIRLLDWVEQGDWLTDLKRRVQHYGWKYNYKLRRVESASYLGPLPKWAQTLGQRLLDLGMVKELPDQVIVNEYVGNQGISKHIDCPDCFRGPIVTISLCETWQMTFRLDNKKFETNLFQRSAVSMDGPARYDWSHEIPQRKTEQNNVRGRRISLTFRKVDRDRPTSVS
ncbi:alpha-ketoglutarate-dependent dioxygenase AlkB [Pseudomonas cichorii]|uniref:alpha-ketoglutarate-dependent dioxygenase AlkB n=1 Tax=Pseudomonas cichorii TaxID=36746 RepID=UPI0018E63D74|nr:alpha-ketoglutarate-dependent dioxygenase AlkB [Pseudomonas cichorii]MBI6856224.1 alpha-ketoglutarate-dependent dioxygenase AlkB [Pseudomonas cichorii]